jgi:hypothetical protein
MSLDLLKEKIEILEQQLLALTSINDICQRSMNDSSRSANLESCADLLNHLLEPTMYQVEAVRGLISEMCERPKIRKLKGV